MTEWNASTDLMAKVRALIQPVQTDEPLRQVLMHDTFHETVRTCRFQAVGATHR